MFLNHSAIYTVHENTWKGDPADRMVLVREGFSFWAFIFAPFWLLSQRLWLATLLYMIAVILIEQLGEYYGISQASLAMLQLGLQFWLGCNAYDIKRWTLKRRGYQLQGLVAADSLLMAQRRAFEHA